MGLPPGIAVGSGVIDAYAGWIGTVGAKVKLDGDTLNSDVAKNDVAQAFTRLAAVAGTSDRKSTRLNSSHQHRSRMPSSA